MKNDLNDFITDAYATLTRLRMNVSDAHTVMQFPFYMTENSSCSLEMADRPVNLGVH